MSDLQVWTRWPILTEFHRQWWRARGPRPGQARRPFSRDWESLLAEAGLTRAELREEAERQARSLEAAGLWKIQPVLRRPHLPGRIQLPVEQEMRLARLFDDPVETGERRFDLSAVNWVPELAFLATERTPAAGEDLLALQAFFESGGARGRPAVPIKERSVEIFGEEKRLDALASTQLFREGRLTLELLGAYYVPEPLGWRRGPRASEGGAVLVLENAATWDSFSRWNAEAGEYAAVVYGAGYRFLDGVPFLREIEKEVGVWQRLDYFGDLDPEGLRIPFLAVGKCQKLGLPAPVPLVAAYELLLKKGRPVDLEVAPENVEGLAWLGEELAQKVAPLLTSGRRLAQEWVGYEVWTGANMFGRQS